MLCVCSYTRYNALTKWFLGKAFCIVLLLKLYRVTTALKLSPFLPSSIYYSRERLAFCPGRTKCCNGADIYAGKKQQDEQRPWSPVP